MVEFDPLSSRSSRGDFDMVILRILMCSLVPLTTKKYYKLATPPTTVQSL